MNLSPFDVAWLAAAIRLATPLLLAAMGELVAERTGMLNIGIEAMMLSGALGGITGAYVTGNLIAGVIVGGFFGIAIAALGAVLTIQLRADQVVVGVGLVLFGRGATDFGFRQWLSDRNVRVGPLRAVELPLLSDIPFVGQALFDQNVVVYATYLLVPTVWFILQRTSWGLMLRAAGERPKALDASGINVLAVRWVGMLTVGFLGGVAGAFLSVGQLGSFNEGMSGGKGFIALAAVVFGGYRPAAIAGACLLFGAVDALQLRLQPVSSVPAVVWLALALLIVGATAAFVRRSVRCGRSSQRLVAVSGIAAASVAGLIVLAVVRPSSELPSQLWIAMPYVAALVVLANLSRSTGAPSALTVPYDRLAH